MNFYNDPRNPNVEYSPVLVSDPDNMGLLLLIEAIENDDAVRVRELCAGGVNVNAKLKNGVTALMVASQYGNPDIVSMGQM